MTKSKWSVDSAHSSVEFNVRHLMISKVKGVFHQFSAEIDADPADLTSASIAFEVETTSVDTRNADRDNHLRSGDFFDAENFPALRFVATEISKTDNDEYAVTGDFTIRDVTRKETFAVAFEGTSRDPWGNDKVGFSVDGKINRSDYGLTYNAALETGGVLIGDQVKINLELQAAKA